MQKFWNSFKNLNHYVPFLDEIVYVQVFREFMIVVKNCLSILYYITP